VADIPKTKKKTDLLKPSLYYSAFWKIDFEELAKKGIKYLIIDVDSTIAPSHSPHVDSRVIESLEKAFTSGYIKKACIVSNTIYKKKEPRVKSMAELLEIPYVCAGLFNQKPNSEPFLKGLELMGATPNETAVIGDQLFTDILGGNKLGMLTILVKPLGPVHWTTILFLRHLRQNRLLKKMGLKLDDFIDKVEDEIEEEAMEKAIKETEDIIQRITKQ
jgi:HAD superfamily phosphatase (TIGR01668 family)